MVASNGSVLVVTILGTSKIKCVVRSTSIGIGVASVSYTHLDVYKRQVQQDILVIAAGKDLRLRGAFLLCARAQRAYQKREYSDHSLSLIHI